MKKYCYPFLFALLFSFSCTEDGDPAMDMEDADPMENLVWLQEMAENLSEGNMSEYSYIKQATYKGQTVFFPFNCCPHCNTALILYDYNGNAIQGEDFVLNDLKNQKLIWQPTNSICNLN